MNQQLSRGVARRLGVWAEHATPPARRAWAQAMRAELEHIDGDRAAIRFAVGCLWAAWSLRLRTPEGLLSAGRAGLVGGLGLMAGFCFVMAVIWETRGAPAALAAGLGLYYLAAATLAARKSLQPLSVWLAGGLVSNTIAWLALGAAPAGSQRFYSAVVLEEFGLLGLTAFAVLALGLLARRVAPDARPEA